MADVPSTLAPKPHAIIIVFPFQGHLIPSVHLSIKLASKGFTITFVNVQAVHRQLSTAQPHGHGADHRDIFATARESGLDIRYTTVSDGVPAELDRVLHVLQVVESHLHRMPAIIDEFVGDIVRTSEPPPTCLIADTFYVWPATVAEKYNLVHVSFWTEPALVFTLYYHMNLLRNNRHFDARKDIIDYIPGVKSIKPTDLMTFFQESDTSTVVYQFFSMAFDSVKRADFVICNTVQELEHETISALRQNQPVFAVGPIYDLGFTKSVVPTSLWAESDCTQWLNAKRPGSVLYVSFGSLVHVSQDRIMEIAHGLWLSKVSFVWVLRRDIVSAVDSYSLPIGFEDYVKDKGLIVPWCSQIDVISHPSTGGFLTHCGWNSILEGVLCGVPLLCFPVLADQITNRKLVVDDWKVGVNLCDGQSVNRLEVAEKIDRLMGGKSGVALRDEMKRLKGTLERAVTADGSSEKNFSQFIDDLKVKIREKNVRS